MIHHSITSLNFFLLKVSLTKKKFQGPPATFLLPQTNEMELSSAAKIRLDMGSRVVERMLNQNTFDEIAQDFRYWEDAADEYREPEGTVFKS